MTDGRQVIVTSALTTTLIVVVLYIGYSILRQRIEKQLPLLAGVL